MFSLFNFIYTRDRTVCTCISYLDKGKCSLMQSVNARVTHCNHSTEATAIKSEVAWLTLSLNLSQVQRQFIQPHSREKNLPKRLKGHRILQLLSWQRKSRAHSAASHPSRHLSSSSAHLIYIWRFIYRKSNICVFRACFYCGSLKNM